MGSILAWGLLFLVVLVSALWVLWPREPLEPAIAFDPASIPEDLDRYLTEAETGVPNLKKGVAKRIHWAGEAGQRTPYSLVYIHGFSATSEEIRPVPDRVAEALGANLYFTRLRGHGRDGTAMIEPRAGDWINDTAEALEIGRRIGNKVIVMSTSTGSTLASLAATEPEPPANVVAQIMVSPNFGLKDKRAVLLDFPAVRYWGPLIAGREGGFEPANELHEYYWTVRYPTQAAMPMVALLQASRKRDYSSTKAPALFLVSDQDEVVRPDITRTVAANWGGGGTVQSLTLDPGDDAYKHIIAGDIVSPGQTDKAVEIILGWLEETLEN